MGSATVRGPVPGSAAAAPGVLPTASLDTHGYTEDEFLLEGRTDAYDPDGIRIADDVPYTTRVLVRRPSRPERASGTVFLDPLHMIREMSASWFAGDWMMANGHTWVGVTVSGSGLDRSSSPRGGTEALATADPERYGSLHLERFDVAPRTRSYPGPNGADSFALRWNMAMTHAQGHPIMRDVAVALHDGQLQTAPVERVYACGFSQTANFWRLFLDHGWHERARDEHDGPLIDAYVLIASGAPVHVPADAALIDILSEAEVAATIVQVPMEAPPDRVVPLVRGYELPGAPHFLGARGWTADTAHAHTLEPYWLVVTAILATLDEQLRGGAPMPHVPRIQRDPQAIDGIARDQHGNALGGVRVPWLEAARAQYLPRCACSPTSGEAVPLATAAAGRSDFERRWDRAATRLVEDRLLLPVHADLLAARPFGISAIV